MEDDRNYRDIRKILISKGYLDSDKLPNFQKYIQVIRDVKEQKHIPEADAGIVEEVFRELAHSAMSMYTQLEYILSSND